MEVKMPVISLFGGANSIEGSYEYDTAEYIGEALGKHGFGIATGGYTGTMEAALKGASKYQVRRIGVTTDFYPNKERNPFVLEEFRKPTYFDRFMELVNVGDAYIILPGGTGTLAEMSSLWAFKSRGVVPDKPFVCVGEQWNEIIQTMAFYSDTSVEAVKHIKVFDSAADAVESILESFNIISSNGDE
jgi:uncharacterized protein (TIGR00725 family)